MNLDFFSSLAEAKCVILSIFFRLFLVHKATPPAPGRATHPTSGHGHNNSKESLRGRKEDRAFGRSTAAAAARRLDAVIVSGTAAACVSRARARPASKRLLIGDDVQFILFFDGFPPSSFGGVHVLHR